MKILVTGGAGFIGSHIVDALIERGHDVVIVDNLSTGKRENINKKARFYNIDIRDKNLEKIFAREKPSIVNHHAAQINVRLSVENPIRDIETNGIGMINLLECSKKYNVKKFIFASIGGAIYEEGKLPVSESSPLHPISPYGITKVLGEMYLDFYNKTYNLNYTSLRYSNVYGPRQNFEGEAGVVAIFSNMILKRQTPIVYGDGLQERDFVYVGDVVDANLKAIENNNALNNSFNISTCKGTNVNAIFALIKKHTDYIGGKIHTRPKKGEIRRIFLSYDKAKKLLGWQPSVSLEEGIKKTIEWYRKKWEWHLGYGFLYLRSLF